MNELKILKLFDPDIRKKNLEAARIALLKRWCRLAKVSIPSPIFIVGCSRSGTTVTFETVCASEEVTSFGYELPQFWNSLVGPTNNNWHSEAAYEKDAIPAHRSAAIAHFYAHLGNKQSVDKTCINVMRIPYLIRLFPDARFLYIYRDGPDNVSSLIDGWRDGRFELTQFLGDFPERVNIGGGEFQVWHFFLPPGWRDYNNASLEEVCAYQWCVANQMVLDSKRFVPETQWVDIRYEDIFTDPVGMYRQAFEHLGLDFTAQIQQRCESLSARPTSIVRGSPQREKWRTRNPEAIERIMDTIEPMRRRLGYVE